MAPGTDERKSMTNAGKKGCATMVARLVVRNLLLGLLLVLSGLGEGCGQYDEAGDGPHRAGGALPTRVWKGHTWNVTSGGMAGVANGDPKNVFVDANGYLHLRITNTNGVWTAAELFTTDKLGFGTYQWQVDGPIDVLDRNVVLGL